MYIHVYNNCIRNIVRDTASACNCSAEQDVREAYKLIDQFERAAAAVGATGKKWLFVAAEVAYDQSNDSPGEFVREMSKVVLNLSRLFKVLASMDFQSLQKDYN